MALVTKAEFARLHEVSKPAVQKWERQGYLVMADGKVDVEKSDARLAGAEMGRFGRSVPARPPELPVLSDEDDDSIASTAVTQRGRRRRVVAARTAGAALVIGDLAPDTDIWGIVNGQFSMIDIIEHVLNQIGPADVVISTWTMGIYDSERAERFCRDGRIKKVRWLVDPSMFSRRPELSGRLVQAFGVDSFRAVNTHAKFAALRADGMTAAIASSMNLNPNNRLENFVISCAEEVCAFYESICDEAFSKLPSGTRTSQARGIFEDLLARFESEQAGGFVHPPVTPSVPAARPDDLPPDAENPLHWVKAEAERRKEIALAQLRQLDVLKRAGEVVDLAMAERVLFDIFRSVRDGWLNWPVRIGPLIAAELNVEADRVTELLNEHVNRHLADLGEPDADFAAGE